MSTAPAFGPFTLQTLAANLANLGDKDRAFASDLLKAWDVCQSKGWNFSPGRAKWAAILADRATKPKAAAPEAAEIGSMSGIDALFNSAAKKLQRPAIVLTAKDMDFSLRLTVAGNGSKAPGSINVTTNGSFEQPTRPSPRPPSSRPSPPTRPAWPPLTASSPGPVASATGL
jgi:hypothetical protein